MTDRYNATTDDNDHPVNLVIGEDGFLEEWDCKVHNKVWDINSLSWVAMTQPGGVGGGYETVWLKNIAGSKVNPAMEDGNLATIAGKDIAKESGGNLATIAGKDFAKESGGNLASLAGKDFATQTTLALIKAKTDNLDTALSGIKTGTDKIISTPATSAKQDTEIANLQALNSLMPAVYDYIALSYTGADLTGVVFKVGGSGGTTISTLTLAYTANVLQSVTKT